MISWAASEMKIDHCDTKINIGRNASVENTCEQYMVFLCLSTWFLYPRVTWYLNKLNMPNFGSFRTIAFFSSSVMAEYTLLLLLAGLSQSGRIFIVCSVPNNMLSLNFILMFAHTKIVFDSITENMHLNLPHNVRRFFGGAFIIVG